eukprot:7378092-Prymnesium_polylepis.1
MAKERRVRVVCESIQRRERICCPPGRWGLGAGGRGPSSRDARRDARFRSSIRSFLASLASCSSGLRTGLEDERSGRHATPTDTLEETGDNTPSACDTAPAHSGRRAARVNCLVVRGAHEQLGPPPAGGRTAPEGRSRTPRRLREACAQLLIAAENAG